MSFRLLNLNLSWFRGASTELHFDTKAKSVVIYGPNGSGKSSIVDGLEYLLSGGKVDHLTNEYSGRRYERSIPNTELPAGSRPAVRLSMTGNIEASAVIGTNNVPACFGQERLSCWSVSRSLIRQERLAAFVAANKTDKYEAVVSLMGLAPLESAAANLRRLRNEVRSASKLDEMQGRLDQIVADRRAAFPGMSSAEIGDEVKSLQAAYLKVGSPPPADLREALAAINVELDHLIGGLDEAARAHVVLGQARDAKLLDRLATAAALAQDAADGAETLLSERLAVLLAADGYRQKLSDTDASIDCPACGRPIPADVFARHVEGETARLQSALKVFSKRSAAVTAVTTALAAVQVALRDGTLTKLWLTPEWVPRRADLEALRSFDAGELETRAAAALGRLLPIAQAFLPFVAAAADQAAPSTQALVSDRDKVKAAADWSRALEIKRGIDSAQAVVKFLTEAEENLRTEIRRQAAATLEAISADVAVMWGVLHREHPIDGVHLYQHQDAERAMDIGVSFHGRSQMSPRLTLSEGFRNALGLCVLLALARRGDPAPVVLDDVVTSFDREHRDGVADLILTQLADRQVVILTHESEWYWELKQRLPGSDWLFKALRPFRNPMQGIAWDNVPKGFEEARRHLDGDDASTSIAKARGAMDHHACIIAERLQLRLPYVRGPANDKRHAHEVMLRMAAESEKNFRRLAPDRTYRTSPDLGAAAKQVVSCLAAWSNVPAHGGYGTKGEAVKLIEAGENLLKVLQCLGCDSMVTVISDRTKGTQCKCGNLQWRFGGA